MSNDKHQIDGDEFDTDNISPELEAQILGSGQPQELPINTALEGVDTDAPANNPDEPVDGEDSTDVTDPALGEEVTYQPDVAEPFTPEQAAHNFKITRPVNKELLPNQSPALSMVREAASTFSLLIERHLNYFRSVEAETTEVTSQDVEWLENLREGFDHVIQSGSYQGALKRKGAEWAQSGTHQGAYIGPSRPKMQLSAKPTKDEQLAFLLKKSDDGVTHEFPMIHTGGWIRMQTPDDIQIANMMQRLQDIPNSLGRDTKGEVFSNKLAAYTDALTDLALSCIVGANFVQQSGTDIEYQLSALDEPLLHMALATTLYPAGFNYSHPCVADMTKCNHVEHARLDMFSLFWYDFTPLTTRQREILSIRFRRELKLEELEEYQRIFQEGRRPITWFGDIGMRMRVPTIATRRAMGQLWIQGMVEQAAGAFSENAGEASRDEYVSRLGRRTQARQYSHWVDAVYTRDEPGADEQLFSEDREVIDAYLSRTLSKRHRFVEFEAAVKDYIDEMLLGIVAIPSYDCPQCNSPIATKFNQRFPHLVPIDVIAIFFTLAALRVSQ